MKTVNVLKNALQKSLEELGILPDFTYGVKKTELIHGDYTTEVALALARKLKENPMMIASKIAERLKMNLGDLVSNVEIAKPGFINIRLSDSMLIKNLHEILSKKQSYCSGFVDDARIHIVEYSSPNIAKPFTIGHLRSTIIGDSIAKILSHCGHNVIRDNHLGDWGTQFGKMIVALKKWGDIDSTQNAENPVKELVALYQRFHQESKESEGENLIVEAREWFVKLEKGDNEARELWKFCVKCSMKEFDLIYNRLGVKFDTYFGESFFENKMHYIFSDIKKMNIGTESEGALIIAFPENSLPPLLVRKSDGSTLYSTRDLATDLYRKKTYGDDVVIINEVGKEQQQYFQQIFKAEEMLGYFQKGQRIHVKHGLYRLIGGKMSTREGNVIWLDEVLNEAVEKATELCEADNTTSAEIIAIGALKFNDLIRDPENDITFSWENILNMKGDSGPYVQYTAVRISSLIEKAYNSGLDIPKHINEVEFKENEKILLRVMDGFYESLNNARQNYTTNPIANFLIKLCHEYNKYYASVNFIKEKDSNGLVISLAVRELIELGLSLLGIKIPEKM